MMQAARPRVMLIGLQRGSGIEPAEISLGSLLSLVGVPEPVYQKPARKSHR
jgi:hypothetical protein